jgi:superfamily II DNA helicase RecQ
LENAFDQITISQSQLMEAHYFLGHDFRPAYTNLGYLKALHFTPILALTTL